MMIIRNIDLSIYSLKIYFYVRYGNNVKVNVKILRIYVYNDQFSNCYGQSTS